MSAPEECPKSPTAEACGMLWVDTGAQWIKRIRTCTRCGWVDPEALDRMAELAVKRTLSASETRTAMAISGDPFTFVQGSDAPLTLQEGLGQALAAASMCWETVEQAGVFDSERALRIYQQTWALVQENFKPVKDLAHDLFALACSAKAWDDAHDKEWDTRFTELRKQYHSLQ